MVLSIGLGLGAALKPWKAKLFPDEHIIIYFILWACLWPAMLLHLAGKGILASLKAFKNYLGRSKHL